CSDGTTDIIQLFTQVPNPAKIHILLQAGNAYSEYVNTEIGKVTISFSNGNTIIENLILGENIRDWRINSLRSVSTVTSENIQQAHEYENGRIDLLTIPLGLNYIGNSLESIEITDTSELLASCIHISGVTVETAQ
ncbi:MAG: hypothetical protein AAFQ07_05960, partial [Chloroflexota bacterium]